MEISNVSQEKSNIINSDEFENYFKQSKSSYQQALQEEINLAEEEEDESQIIISDNNFFFKQRITLENIYDILSKKDEDELKLILEDIEDILNSIENGQKKKLNQEDFRLISIIEEEIAGKNKDDKKIFLEFIINIIKWGQYKDNKIDKLALNSFIINDNDKDKQKELSGIYKLNNISSIKKATESDFISNTNEGKEIMNFINKKRKKKEKNKNK